MKYLKLFEDLKIIEQEYDFHCLNDREIQYIFSIYSILKKSKNTFKIWDERSTFPPSDRKRSIITIFPYDPNIYHPFGRYEIKMSKDDGYYYLEINSKFEGKQDFKTTLQFDSLRNVAYFICLLPQIGTDTKISRLISTINTDLNFNDIFSFDFLVKFARSSDWGIRDYVNTFKCALKNKNIIFDYDSIVTFAGYDYIECRERIRLIIDSGRIECIKYLVDWALEGNSNNPNSDWFKDILRFLNEHKYKLEQKDRENIESAISNFTT